jgi:signal peptidase I
MRKFFKGLAWTLGILAVIALALRVLVLEVWTVPDEPVLGASVAPTLAPGDVVLVLTRGTPTFGELARCTDVGNPGSHLVGRIAGVKGDVVETDGSTLLVNGTNYNPESACPDPQVTVKHPVNGNDVTLRCDVIAMGGGRHFRASGPRHPLERKQKTEVQPDTVFLVSDNRSFHDDSRDFGLQPLAACKHRIVFRFWSKDGWSDEARRFSYIR